MFRFLSLKKASRAEINIWRSDVPYGRGESALETGRGLRARRDLGQDISFCECEVSHLTMKAVMVSRVPSRHSPHSWLRLLGGNVSWRLYIRSSG